MSVLDIAALPVSNISDDNSHLYLWTTNNYLESAISVMKAWGFAYKTKITWVKGVANQNGTFSLENPGLGQYFRGVDEVCLFGVRGSLPYRVVDGKRQQGKTVIIAPRREHSRKPDEMMRMIETVSYPDRIELFARREADGWDCWGDQVSTIRC